MLKDKTASEAIDELGGPRMVGTLLGVNERVVWNWRERGFPSHRYPQIRALLKKQRVGFRRTMFPRIGNGK